MKVRPVFKYIFCGLVLAALIFICFCVFYIANTYSITQRNKSNPVFGYHTASYFASVTNPDIREIEDIQPPEEPYSEESGGGESFGGSFSSPEPPEELPETEPEPAPQEEPYTETAPENDVDAAGNPQAETQDIQSPFESYEHENEEPDETAEESGGYYTETELLYSILVTMKINQYIGIFVLAVALIILIFKPVDRAFFT